MASALFEKIQYFVTDRPKDIKETDVQTILDVFLTHDYKYSPTVRLEKSNDGSTSGVEISIYPDLLTFRFGILEERFESLLIIFSSSIDFEIFTPQINLQLAFEKCFFFIRKVDELVFELERFSKSCN